MELEDGLQEVVVDVGKVDGAEESQSLINKRVTR
jgi:hypothetical protein